jgi:hypothetical protein
LHCLFIAPTLIANLGRCAMRWTRFLPLALVSSSLCFVVAACSSSSTSTPGGGTADCAGFASTVCTKFQSCAPFYVDVLFASLDECKARYTSQCQAGTQNPGVTNEAALLGSCSNVYATETCDAFLSGAPAAGCTPQPGSFANGQACGDSAQCQSLFCNKPSGATCGACAAAPKVGDTCTTSCGIGLNCTGGKCATPTPNGALGAACSNTAPCAANLVCFNGTCSQPSGAGKPCGGTTPACDQLHSLSCQGGVCAQLQMAGPGQPCGLSGSTYVLCKAGGTCKTASGASAGTCLAAAEDGQACDDTNGPSCKYGASCVNGLCTLNAASTCK